MTLESTPDNALPRAASFWPRLGALLIDIALIYVIASMLGKTFYAPLMQFNPWLPWVGQLLLLAYFGLAESRLAQGQTLGKAILRLQTIGAAGPLLRIPHAFARAAIKTLCFCVVLQPDKLVLAFSPSARPALILTLFLVTIFALALLIGEIITLFMHPRRRALHDLLAGTRVVRMREANELVEDPDLNPIEESRQRLARRFGLFAVFTSFMLLSWFAIDQAWLSVPAREERALRAHLTPQLKLGPYRLQGVSFPSPEKSKRVFDFITASRTKAREEGTTIPTTDSLRSQYFFDDDRILAVYDRAQGTLRPEELSDPALVAQINALRQQLWDRWLSQSQGELDAQGQPLQANAFECILHESLSLLYYRLSQPETTVRFFGPADPTAGPVTFEIVKTLSNTTSTSATAQPATPTPIAAPGQPLDADSATTH